MGEVEPKVCFRTPQFAGACSHERCFIRNLGKLKSNDYTKYFYIFPTGFICYGAGDQSVLLSSTRVDLERVA